MNGLGSWENTHVAPISKFVKSSYDFLLQSYCTDANVILKIKNLIMLFSNTLSVSILFI
jgi:hypothetical protein